MTDFSQMTMGDIAALNTPEALDYFWAHVDDGYFADRIGFYEDVLDASATIISHAKVICDYGCSCGHLISLLLRRLPDTKTCTVFGLDYAASAVKRANETINAKFFCRDITKAFFLPSVLDLAYCVESLEHIANYEDALMHIFAALKPGGWLFITVPNKDGWIGHVNHWSQSEFQSVLSAYGEAKVDVFRDGHNLIAKVVKR